MRNAIILLSFVLLAACAPIPIWNKPLQIRKEAVNAIIIYSFQKEHGSFLKNKTDGADAYRQVLLRKEILPFAF